MRTFVTDEPATTFRRTMKCPGCDSEIILKEIMHSTRTEVRYETELCHVRPIKADGERDYLCRLVLDVIKRELPGYMADILKVSTQAIGQMRSHLEEQSDRKARVLNSQIESKSLGHGYERH